MDGERNCLAQPARFVGVLWVPTTRSWALTCNDASRLSERHPAADSSTNTEDLHDQPRQGFGHPRVS